MKMSCREVFLLILAVSICSSSLFYPTLLAQQSERSPAPQIETEGTQEVIEPAPKDIKEAVGIYVFLGWIWISIFVLVYILRQKIKEADRIYRLRFFSPGKS